MRKFLSYLGSSQIVRSISWGGGEKKKINRNTHYSNIFLVAKSLCSEKFSETDRVVLVGGLIFSNVVFALLLFLRKIEFDYMPLSHWTSWSLSQKIFSVFPEVNSLKTDKKRVIGIKTKSKVVNMVLVLAKKIFFIICRPIFKKSSVLWVASSWEATESARSLKKNDLSYRIYQFGCDLSIEMPASSSYYEQYLQNVNIVFWGRVDYLHKGLDRLVKSCEINHHFLLQNRVLIHILGPDYNGGLDKLRSEIALRGIEDLFKIITTDKLDQIGIEGLAWADGTLLFTRFEGHARVLREAQYFGVPVLSSTEAHNNWYTDSQDYMTIDFLMDHDEGYNRSKIRSFIQLCESSRGRREKVRTDVGWECLAANQLLASAVKTLKLK